MRRSRWRRRRRPTSTRSSLHGHALVQPFQDAVNDARERSLVYIGGAFSHAFTKPPFLRGVGDGLGEQRHEPSAAERLLAEHALEAARRRGHLRPRRRRADAGRPPADGAGADRARPRPATVSGLGRGARPGYSGRRIARAPRSPPYRMLVSAMVSLPIMDAVQKITVGISSELLAKAQRASGAGITETVRTGLQLVAASEAYARLRQLRGKVRFSRSAADLKADR